MDRRKFLASATKCSLSGAALAAIEQARYQTQQDVRGAESGWDSIPSQCPPMDDLVWFNTGGLGILPDRVLRTVVSTMERLRSNTSHGHNLVEQSRPAVAAFLGCDPDELAFTRNATEGNSTIAAGLRLVAGDEVIIDSHAHQGGSMAWMTRQEFDGVNLRIFDPDPGSIQGNLDRIESLITDRTRVIQVSHVTAPTGIRMPVHEISAMAADRNIWFHIDGAQSAGMFPFSVSEIACSSFATCCHKWMCGPRGTGILFVRKELLDRVMPTDVGSYADNQWDLPATIDYVDSATRFECGTRDAAAIQGVVSAIDYALSLDPARVSDHSHRLAWRLHRELAAIDRLTLLSPAIKNLRSAMVSFTVEGANCDEVFRALVRDGFRCRPVRERNLNATRISTHWFNNEEQCERLLDCVRRNFGR